MDIKITGVDEGQSRKPDPNMALYEIHLNLSERLPPGWSEYFAREWSFPRHSMWRRAWVEGDQLVIHCVPDELEKHHLPYLKEAVKNATEKYEAARTAGASERDRRRAEADEERARFSDAISKIDFDKS